MGKRIANVYYIRGKVIDDSEDESLPASVGLSFKDGSKYHVRIAGHGGGDVDYSGGCGKVEGDEGEIIEASLFSKTAYEFSEWDNQPGDYDHVMLGIKFDGDWQYFEGEENEYDSDGESATVHVYHDVHLIKMPGGGTQSARGRRRVRRR